MPGDSPVWASEDVAALRRLALCHAETHFSRLYPLLPDALRAQHTYDGARLRLKRLGLGSRVARVRTAAHARAAGEDLGAPVALPVAVPPAPEPEVPPDPAQEAQKATSEERAQRRLHDAERKAKALQGVLADRQELAEALRDEMRVRPPVQPLPSMPLDLSARDEVEFFLFISDVHCGQYFPVEDSGGLGEYDMDAYAERAARYADVVDMYAAIYRQSFRLNTCTTVWGGDLIDGRLIHPGHEISSAHIATQLTVGPEVMAQNVARRLGGQFGRVDHFFTPGNHGREGRKGQLHRVKDNFDAVFYHWMGALCRDIPNMHWHPPAQWYVDLTLQGHRYFCGHGDNFRSWLGIPFYGLVRNKGRMEGIMNEMVDVVVTGHHHSPGEFHVNHGVVVSNGSWVGPSEFGNWLGMSSPAIQKLVVIHREFPVMAIHDIYLVKPGQALSHSPVNLDALRAAT